MKYVEMNEGGLSSMSETRPKFEELKTGMRIGKIKNVWYLTRSRWSRNTIEDLLMRDNYFVPYKVKVFEGENGQRRKFEDSKDEMLDTILTTVQQFDRKQRREISISGKKHLSLTEGKNGVFMGGTINFGFKNVDKKWTIDTEESKWVKKIFKLFNEGKSIKDIKTYLDTNNVKPKRNKLWSMGTIHTMLRNKVYIGEYTWKDKESGNKYDIVIPQIISHSVFNKTQKILDKNQRNKGNNLRKYESLLSDLMTCYCGENICGKVRKTTNYKTYFCSSKVNKWKGKNVKVCQNRRTLNMDKTDEFIIKKVKEIMKDSVTLKERFKEDILKHKGVRLEELEKEKTELESSIKPIDKQIDLVTKSISQNEVNNMLKKIEKKLYTEIKNTLDDELKKLTQSKEKIIQNIYDIDNQSDWIDWIGKYGKDVSEKMSKVDTKMLEGIVDEIIVHPTFSKNRDKDLKQVGHMFQIKFKLPIVNDELIYKNPKKKSEGYSIKKGKSKVEDTQTISVGGRGKKV